MSTTKIKTTEAGYAWLSVSEAATYLAVTERQVRRWVAQGRIPVTKLGLHLRFRRDELDAWVAACSRSVSA